MSFRESSQNMNPEAEARDGVSRLINDIKKNAKNFHKLEKIFLELENLRSQGLLEETNFRKQLKETEQTVQNFWVKLKIKRLLHRPLEDWGRTNKIALLAMEQIYTNLDKETLEEMGDDEVGAVFDEYRRNNYEFFEWHERVDLNRDSESGVEYLREDYAIDTGSLCGRPNDLMVSEKWFRNTAVVPIDNRHGAVYSETSRPLMVFALDPSVEKAAEERAFHDRGIHEFLLNIMDQVIETNDIEKLFFYLQFRSCLPEEIRNKLDAVIGVEISETYNRVLERDQFEESVAKDKERWQTIFENIGILLAKLARKELQKLIQKEEREFRGRHADCALGRSQLSVLLECVTNDAAGRYSDRPQHTILRFFFNLPKLPKQTREAFKKNFPGLAEQINLSDIKSFDGFMKTPSERLWKYIDGLGENRKTVAGWCVKNLSDLMSEIQQSLPKPKTQTIKESVSQDTDDYLFLMSLPVRKEMEATFGFSLAKLGLREQIQFLNFIKTGEFKTVERVSVASKKFGSDIARCFLSCEYGDKFREVVLSISEKLPEELARQVFEQYGKLALLAQEKSEELVREFTAEGKELKVSAAAVEQELLRRAKDFLAEIAEAAEVSPKVVAEKMARYETDMVVFAGIFKAAFKDATEVNLEKIRGLKLESQTTAEILPTDKTAMMDIFSENWREQKPESAEYLTQQLKDKLTEMTTDSKFYLLKKDGKLIAFVCFDAIHDIDGRPALYGKSFNIKKDLRGSAIGEAIMKNTVNAEAAEKTIIIDVFPELIAGTKYVEDFGFTVVGVKEFPAGEDGKTETRIIMKRDDRAAKAYRRKKIKPESFDLSEGTDEMTERIKTVSEQGFVGTKYFADPENKNLRYIVFEPTAETGVLSAAA